ncbi:1-aminocyclopropane-1-carboxylate deaminase/D-cysteine desulfhydrase [Cellulomonas sp. NPDC057328]|uniref:1-aminocyclopropane-1-carboxylate deaminase/D-cysteine desulfhydrase n=1 Tax=Cellulomonas sp. NPDC057328 TaxID=3346101 RepID=UPI00363FFCBF
MPPTTPDAADLTAAPLQRMPVLAAALGIAADDLLVLREDLVGTAGGGNKVRKAEAALLRARADGIRTVVTTGAPQSNHARAVAAVGARLGLRVVLVLRGDDPGRRTGNVLLDHLLGADVRWAGDADLAECAADAARAADGPTRVIPFGGSDAAAVDVYAAVGADLDARVPGLRHAVVAVGSGATAAGLVAALGAERVLGVDTGAVPDPRSTVLGLLRDARPDAPWDGAALRLDHQQVGTGYGRLQPAVLDAVRSVARGDGVLVDVTYAGRALAGLVAAVRSGVIAPGERAVLVHTGGLPGAFGHPELERALG